MTPGPVAEALPVERIRAECLKSVAEHPVVITSPTGSGKSTQVPRWLGGRVLVVEPRRVACRSLASRVATLEGCTLGDAVGFHVRDHRVAGAATRLLFATPGIVLRRFHALVHGTDAERFTTIVLDELHERSMEVDLLLALLHKHHRGPLVVMSATLDAERVAAHLGGVHIHAEGRAHPVEVLYRPDRELLPDGRDLDRRVPPMLAEALEHAGDVLVFLPGKAEIAAVGQALSRHRDLDVVPLHGGLTLQEQTRAFETEGRRKVILATNVAETSVTLPRIGVVVDTGLVRRTRYHQGRGFLTLLPVAADSAEQRAGRAGRTGPGVCLRMWDRAAKLSATTPPEIRRESLVPLMLAAAACGERVEDLPLLDPPQPYAVQDARQELIALGALDEAGALAPLGAELFGLPLDPPLGRLLVEARERGTLEDAVDLVSVLATGRPVFQGAFRGDGEDLRESGCDATAFITALRRGHPAEHGLRRFTLSEARANSRRLRKAFGLLSPPAPNRPVDREALAQTALAADPRSAFVARRRKRHIAWSNGGTEIELGRESGANAASRAEALVVFETRALGVGRRDKRIVATCASPVPLTLLRDAGLGRDRLAGVSLDRGRPVVRVERVFARKVLEEREQIPTGRLAREAIAELVTRGSLLRGAYAGIQERLGATTLASRLMDARLLERCELPPWAGETDASAWLLARLESLGVEHADDAALLRPGDLLPDALPDAVLEALERGFPRTLHLGDADYSVRYDLARRQVTLEQQGGQRHKPPALSFLPRFAGFQIRLSDGKKTVVLRG